MRRSLNFTVLAVVAVLCALAVALWVSLSSGHRNDLLPNLFSETVALLGTVAIVEAALKRDRNRRAVEGGLAINASVLFPVANWLRSLGVVMDANTVWRKARRRLRRLPSRLTREEEELVLQLTQGVRLTLPPLNQIQLASVTLKQVGQNADIDAVLRLNRLANRLLKLSALVHGDQEPDPLMLVPTFTEISTIAREVRLVSVVIRAYAVED